MDRQLDVTLANGEKCTFRLGEYGIELSINDAFFLVQRLCWRDLRDLIVMKENHMRRNPGSLTKAEAGWKKEIVQRLSRKPKSKSKPIELAK